jgi:hypothetical protein
MARHAMKETWIRAMVDAMDFLPEEKEGGNNSLLDVIAPIIM